MSVMPSDLQLTFGQRVRAERERKGLSQADLARLLEIHQPDLCDIEKGRHAPTLETVGKIALKLDVPATDLLSPSRI